MGVKRTVARVQDPGLQEGVEGLEVDVVIDPVESAAQEIVRRDTDKAAEVMSRIETVGRESLSEMRRMLGVLRNGEEPDLSLAPQPTLRDVAGAVANGGATISKES